jgi:hypothetical protein
MFGKIMIAKRLNNSVNGNPRYQLVIQDLSNELHMVLSSSDASCNYDVLNVKNSGETVEFGFTRAGRVNTITRSK